MDLTLFPSPEDGSLLFAIESTGQAHTRRTISTFPKGCTLYVPSAGEGERGQSFVLRLCALLFRVCAPLRAKLVGQFSRAYFEDVFRNNMKKKVCPQDSARLGMLGMAMCRRLHADAFHIALAPCSDWPSVGSTAPV